LNAIAELNDLTDRSLLIVEDDKPFLERLSRAMETRGFAVTSCDTVSDGLAQIGRAAPAFAVVDLRLGDGNGLDVVSALKRKRPEARAIVLTGYGNIATAVTAEHAPPHPAAHSGETRAALNLAPHGEEARSAVANHEA
jgi:two-component system response regulator RegA